jgi:hypothetical protein
VYDFAFGKGEGVGVGEIELDVGAGGDDEWIADWETTWAGEGALQPLPKIRLVATAAATTESMVREDGEFMPSPTNPIP